MKQLYCNSLFNFSRTSCCKVDVKQVKIGGEAAIVVQSMGVVSSLDTVNAVEEAKRIINAGGEMVRFTAASVAEARGVGSIRSSLREQGYTAPIIADVHFNPEAAFVAAELCDKVRINPGNFIDPRADFSYVELSDEQYNNELERIEVSLSRLIDICRQNDTALRIGVNHGSLSDRIMSRYGNTPEGMVASAMEFLRVCRKKEFNNVVVSMKSSTTPIMVRAYRQLNAAMIDEGFVYPLHLGVTEAGEGCDGRIRSSVGIGTLLNDGLGDTIRVSLTEPPENEIAVARELLATYRDREQSEKIIERSDTAYHPYSYHRSETVAVCGVGGDNAPVVVGYDIEWDENKFISVTNDSLTDTLLAQLKEESGKIVVISSKKANRVADMRAAILALRREDINLPVIVKFDYQDDISFETLTIRASADVGLFFVDALSQGLWIEYNKGEKSAINDLGLSILQAAGARISRTEYISCPGCGRTMFDIQSRVKEVKECTKELTGLKIAVMGCIVNGPGEMADAQYGYVGAGKGKVSLYKDGKAVAKSIDEEVAVDRLIELIKDNGDWK